MESLGLGPFATFALHEACTKATLGFVLIVSQAQLPHVLGRRSAAQRKGLPMIPLELVTRATALAIGTLEATGITVARTHLTLHFSRHSRAVFGARCSARLIDLRELAALQFGHKALKRALEQSPGVRVGLGVTQEFSRLLEQLDGLIVNRHLERVATW